MQFNCSTHSFREEINHSNRGSFYVMCIEDCTLHVYKFDTNICSKIKSINLVKLRVRNACSNTRHYYYTLRKIYKFSELLRSAVVWSYYLLAESVWNILLNTPPTGWFLATLQLTCSILGRLIISMIHGSVWIVCALRGVYGGEVTYSWQPAYTMNSLNSSFNSIFGARRYAGPETRLCC